MLSRIAGELVVDLVLQYVVPYLLREAASVAKWQATTESPRRDVRGQAARAHLWVVPQPSPYSRLTVLSRTPGRVRMRVDGLRGDSASAAVLTEPLRELPGVRFARANHLTGAVLIEYDPARLGEGELLSILENNAALAPARSPVQLDVSEAHPIGERRPNLAFVGV